MSIEIPIPVSIPRGMTPQEAKAQFNATHYSTAGNGITPQMYYKRESIPVSDGTIYDCWVYLSYCNLWQGSAIRVGSKEAERLIPIE